MKSGQKNKSRNLTTEGFEPSLFRTGKIYQEERPETCAITTRPSCRNDPIGLKLEIIHAGLRGVVMESRLGGWGYAEGSEIR